MIHEGGANHADLMDRLSDDPLVSSLLLLHDLHPVDIETRLLRALDKVRPYLQTHGGNVELLGVQDGAIRLRLQGSCHGCASSAMTLKLAIEAAIYEAAPDFTTLEVEGVVEQRPPSNLVQLDLSSQWTSPQICTPEILRMAEKAAP
jgi:Fe-S cluster biogenesis protein NfuA